MIENVARIHITEVELEKDVRGVLARVRQGMDVVIEEDEHPVAVIRKPEGRGRKLSECIALAKAYEGKLGYAPIPDADFAKDIQAAVDAHREGLNPPSWD